MSYIVNGTEVETDDQGYVLEPDYSEDIVRVIAQAESITTCRSHDKSNPLMLKNMPTG